MDNVKLSQVSQSKPQLVSSSIASGVKTPNLSTSHEASPQSVAIANGNKQSIEALLNNSKELEHALEKLTQLADNSGRALGFSKDQTVSGPVITVTDKDTGEVIRQIPTEVVVRVAHSIEKMKGLLFDKSL